MIFDHGGAVVASAQREFRQILPRPGWVEHDPNEIPGDRGGRDSRGPVGGGHDRSEPGAAVGITNQRETTVVWDRTTGAPLANAIVWQDTRTGGICETLAEGYGIDRFRDLTGLPLATYFSGPKATWLLANVEGLEDLAAAGRAVVGTVDSWIVWNLTGGTGGGQHVTDVTNASRTLLMDLDTLAWSDDLLEAMGVPRSMMARILPSIGRIGIGTGVLAGVPISAILGDQQAALFGQACYEPGDAKNTYGTGCFMLMNTGARKVPSRNGLLTTVAYRIAGGDPVYALEGSVAVTGAVVQWLRDNLGLISTPDEVESLAASVEDNGDVYFVPAFSGLFAPHWRSDARGVITGLTRFARSGHIARAALEATAYQTRESARGDAGRFGGLPHRVEGRRGDGGQRVADAVPVRHPRRSGDPSSCERDDRSGRRVRRRSGRGVLGRSRCPPGQLAGGTPVGACHAGRGSGGALCQVAGSGRTFPGLDRVGQSALFGRGRV